MPNLTPVEPEDDAFNSESSIVGASLSAAIDSSKRSRVTIIVLIIASVLSFMSAWNTRKGNWHDDREASAHKALEWVVFFGEKLTSYEDSTLAITYEELIKPLEDSVFSVRNEFFENSTYSLPKGLGLKIPEKYHRGYTNEELRLSIQSDSSYLKAILYCSAQPVYKLNRQKIMDRVKFMDNDYYDKSISIAVPFFGVVIDVNDLGLFSGITFIIILIMLRFSLNRELNNINHFFSVTQSSKNSNLYYDLLGMYQIFTVHVGINPASNSHSAKIKNPLWRYVPRLLLLLPVFSYIYVYLNDFSTLIEGMINSASSTSFISISSTLFLLIISYLTFICLRILGRIERKWIAEAKEYHRIIIP